MRSHAQKHFLKLEKSGCAETVPPARPKRKPDRPYPKGCPSNGKRRKTGQPSAAQAAVDSSCKPVAAAVAAAVVTTPANVTSRARRGVSQRPEATAGAHELFFEALQLIRAPHKKASKLCVAEPFALTSFCCSTWQLCTCKPYPAPQCTLDR